MHIITLTHGVNTRVDSAEWLDDLKAYLDMRIAKQGIKETEVLVHRWNPYWLEFFTFTPTLIPRWQWETVKEQQKHVTWIRQNYGVTCRISAFAHSWGCFKTYMSMSYPSKYPNAFFEKIVLVAPPLSTRIRPNRVVPGHFAQIHVYFSHDDEIIPYASTGNAGWAPLVYADSEKGVYDYEARYDLISPFRHSSYFREPAFSVYKKEWGDILLGA